MIDIYLLIDLIVIAGLAILGLAVLLQDKKSALNRSFVFFVFSVGVWLIANYVSNNISNSEKVATIANYFVFAFSYFAAYSLLYFGAILAQDDNSRKWINRFAIVTLAIGVLSFTPLFITGVSVQGSIYAVEFGPLIPIYAVSLLATLGWLFFVIIKNLRTSSGVQKARLRTLLISLIFALPALVLAQFIIPATFGWFGLTNIGVTAMLIMVIGLYYGVFKHKLFSLRLVVVRSLTYAFAVGILSVLYGAVSYYLTTLIPASTSNLFYQEAINVILIILAVSVYSPLINFFKRITDSIFYRDAYDPQKVINEINSTLVNSLDLEKLLNDTAKIIERDLRCEFADFYLEPRASIEFHLAGSNAKLFATSEWKDFSQVLGSLDAKSVDSKSSDIDVQTKDLMSSMGLEVAIKMLSNGENVGYMLIGGRKSGNSFTGQDIQLLQIIADEVAIAVQNALRFEEISQFNVTLQKKIDDATNQLQKSNEKLQKLDEAKDEFISMASHQLRTPLTSVKGYISMILEEDAGPINDQQRTFLDQAFLSSQRMVYLIADLLNVSRLKTGKFIIEPKPTYLPDVVESEIAQLYETAKARDLNLVFNKPDEFPTLNLDETKIRQVIMNFADNAIYYTPKGGKITINLKATDDAIEYTVRDTGIGVPKSEQHHLFMKFYRAGNARKARPDGTGLGLFMAKKVVVAQGGGIIFKTEEGKGSTFGFSFPRAKLEVEQKR